MNRRRYELLACGLGVCLIAAQVAIKPRPVDGSWRGPSELARRDAEWRNRQAPEFELMLRDGSTFRLAEHVRRQVVVLNFFATWREACAQELPDMQRYIGMLQREHKPILAVAIDAQEQSDLVDRFSRRLDLTLPIGIDDSGRVTQIYDVTAFPTTVVIGADGRVQLHETGEILNQEVAFGAILNAEFDVILKARPL